MSMSTLPIHAKSGRERGPVGARNGRDAEINVTPLIDILLVLLIIFMVILPQHELGELAQIPQPNPDKRAANPTEPIVIQLKNLGKGKRPELAINQKQVGWDELARMLETIFRSRSDRTAFVKGDPEIEFSFVAEALDISHRAGAERVGLLGKNIPVDR
jgi:biopolymer transport protein TolR